MGEAGVTTTIATCPYCDPLPEAGDRHYATDTGRFVISSVVHHPAEPVSGPRARLLKAGAMLPATTIIAYEASWWTGASEHRVIRGEAYWRGSLDNLRAAVERQLAADYDEYNAEPAAEDCVAPPPPPPPPPPLTTPPNG